MIGSLEFDIYKKNVVIKQRSGKEITLELRPLNGRFLPKFFNLVSKMQTDDKTADMTKLFADEAIVGDIHFLIKETLKKSYPDQKEEVLDEFVSQNMWKLLEGLMDVNVGTQE